MDSVLEKAYSLVVRVVDAKQNKPVKNVNIKVFRLEKEPISLKQWSENLKTGTPFKCLMLSTNSDNNGNVTVKLPEGAYEVKVEAYGLSRVCELKQNVEVLFAETRKRWWQ